MSGRYLRLDFQPQSTLAVGPFAAQVTLRGGVAEEPTLYRLHISGTLGSDLYFNPAELLLTAESPNTAYLTVQSRIGRPFRVARIEAPAGVQVEAANASLEQPTHRLSVIRVETSEGLRGQSLALFAEDPRRAARLHFR